MNMAFTALFAYFATDSRAVELRHHPIKQCKSGAFGLTHLIRSETTVLHSCHLITGALKRLLEESQRKSVVVCDQDSSFSCTCRERVQCHRKRSDLWIKRRHQLWNLLSISGARRGFDLCGQRSSALGRQICQHSFQPCAARSISPRSLAVDRRLQRCAAPGRSS